jgi:hypothetical protein
MFLPLKGLSSYKYLGFTSIKYPNIIVINRREEWGLIVDPTVRFEVHDKQPQEVHEEKRAINEKTVNYYSESYNISKFQVYGLMIGARGTIPKHTQEFWTKFKLENNILNLISLTVVKYSISIIRNHLYRNN